jgi:hypothetical protein
MTRSPDDPILPGPPFTSSHGLPSTLYFRTVYLSAKNTYGASANPANAPPELEFTFKPNIHATVLSRKIVLFTIKIDDPEQDQAPEGQKKA